MLREILPVVALALALGAAPALAQCGTASAASAPEDFDSGAHPGTEPARRRRPTRAVGAPPWRGRGAGTAGGPRRRGTGRAAGRPRRPHKLREWLAPVSA